MTAPGLTLASRTLGAFLLLLLPIGALAQPKAPPAPKRFFTDSTGAIPTGVAAQIEQRLQTFQKISSNQILVVVSDRLPAGYTSMEEYTNRTAQAWRAGVKGRDNGAVLFVFLNERKLRIEVGYGLEGALPDALASRIINNEITPRFKEKNYGAGLLAGVDAIIRATRGEYKPVAARAYVAPPQPIAAPVSGGPSIFDNPVIAVFAFVLFIVALVLIFKALARYDADGSAGGSDWSSSGTDWSSSGSSSSSASSGFSGGGGSFGGGGASGSW